MTRLETFKVEVTCKCANVVIVYLKVQSRRREEGKEKNKEVV